MPAKTLTLAAANSDDSVTEAAAEAKTQLLRFAAYDPLTGHLKNASDFEAYDLFPQGLKPSAASFRLMVLGSSTTQFPLGKWPQYLTMMLGKRLGPTLTFNGATSGYFSSIELLKVLRDAPGIRPDLIVSMSGIADIGFLHARPTTPLLHRNSGTIANFLVGKAKAFSRVSYGVPQKIEPHELWLRNTRLTRVIAEELGIPYIVFLEPTLARGGLNPCAKEEQLMNSDKMNRHLPNTGRSYKEEANFFYDRVQEALAARPEYYDHIVDISNVFEGHSIVYRDFRHANERGNKLIARRMFDELVARADRYNLTRKAKTAAPAAEAGAAEPAGYQVELCPEKDSSWIISFSGRRAETDQRKISAWGPFEFVKTLYGKNLHQFYVRDRDNLWYQYGIDGLAENIDAAAKAMHAEVQKAPHKRVVTIGNSMGGYAAILYGILAGVDKVIAFAPQSFISHDMRQQHGDKRWQSDLGRIPHEDMPYPDLLPLIEAHPEVKIAVYYCEGDELDKLHAERLRQLPNVSIHTLESDDHNVGRALKKLGLLAQIVDREIEDLPIPPVLTQDTSIYSAAADKVVFSSTIDEEEC